MYSIESTGDPHTIKVTVSRRILERGSETFESAAMAAFSPLASALFGVAGIRRVELSRSAILLTKAAGSDWAVVRPLLEKTLASYFS